MLKLSEQRKPEHYNIRVSVSRKLNNEYMVMVRVGISHRVTYKYD